MRVPLLLTTIALLAGACRSPVAAAGPGAGGATGPALAHGVFFSLRDPSPRAVAELAEECRALCRATPGVLAWAVGPRTPDLTRDFNDQDFDLALWVVFEDRAAHDAYQVSPAHVALVESLLPGLEAVRVFDADTEFGDG